VLHIITHLAVGGATENTLTTCRLSNPDRIETAVLSGATSAQEAALANLAEEWGVTVYPFPSLVRSIRPGADLHAYYEMAKWLRRENWDVVHTHGSKAGIIGRLAAKKAGVPVIIHTVHGWGHHDRQHPASRALLIAAERRAARITDKLIVVADANREKGLGDSIGKFEQYTTIHSGIDIARYRDVRVDREALRASLGIPANALVVGTVSRLAEQKAPWDFVKMAALVNARRPDVHFVFVGGGPMQAQFEAEVRAAGLEKVVHLAGYRNDIPEILRTFDIFALSSLWEGLPRVFAQAMCASLPIVATRVDGAPEAVYEGENGFLTAPGEPDQLAERALRLLEDAALRHAMGSRGFEIVDPAFSDREMVRQIEEVYFTAAQVKLVAAALEPVAARV
jgi:glycosyltransferase involved in cell wall biosynthesis